jgi:DNA-binding transcriptional ArsR family regulator
MVDSINKDANDIQKLTESFTEAGDMVRNIVKHPLRMLIFLLLYMYPSLNVTEISKKLNRSKATVSRHLKAMEEEKILVSHEEKTQGKYSPKIYQLPKSTLYIIKNSSRPQKDSQKLAGIGNISKLFDSNLRLSIYRDVLELIRSFSLLISNGFSIVAPYLEIMEKRLNNIDEADDTFIPMLMGVGGGLDFDSILISESKLPEIKQIYKEFIDKVYKVIDSEPADELRSIVMINAFLPLKDVLEFGSNNEE